jgi:hypothetical protein
MSEPTRSTGAPVVRLDHEWTDQGAQLQECSRCGAIRRDGWTGECPIRLRESLEMVMALLEEGYVYVDESRPGETVWLADVEARLWP